MTKERLMQMAENYRQKADRDFRNYQESGIGRFGTAYHRHEELADALTMAAEAADEHAAYLALKHQMYVFANRANEIQHAHEMQREKLALELAKQVLAYGRLQKLVREDSLWPQKI